MLRKHNLSDAERHRECGVCGACSGPADETARPGNTAAHLRLNPRRKSPCRDVQEAKGVEKAEA